MSGSLLNPNPASPQDHEPDTVATPEGDNEFAPDQPLKPAPEGLQRTPAIDTKRLNSVHDVPRGTSPVEHHLLDL